MNYKFQIHHEVNIEGRDFIIGDLHGMYEALMVKLHEVSFDEDKDRLFSVGDLIDRGPDSLKCLKLIEKDWFFPVLGNHEDMMIGDITDGIRMHSLWIANGGEWALKTNRDFLEPLVELLVQTVPLTRTVALKSGKTIGISHAEPHSSKFKVKSEGSYDEQILLWSRSLITHKEQLKMEDVDYTYHGHTPLHTVNTIGQQTYIDTGACFDDGFLTMLELK